MKNVFVMLVLSGLCSGAGDSAQQKPFIKIFFTSDASVASSGEVIGLLKQKMNATHLFEIVGQDNPNLVLIVDCTARDSASEPYTCMYVGHYAGTTFKTLLGAGLWNGKSADDVATAFLAAVASDISERWNGTIRTDQIASLETCLFLTESNCAVPDGLQTELKAKSINLSQYLRKGTLKK
jgi:hypothetical protein